MYMRQLDGLRCIAVALVLLAHWRIVPGVGYIGVRVFFVLSGFLVTSILLEGGSLRSFYVRRALRIFPAFYLVAGVAALFGNTRVLESWPYVFSYTGNFSRALGGHIGPIHFWSLYVEEQFYLVWPFLLLLVPKKSFVRVVAMLMVASVLYRLSIWYAGNWSALRLLPLSYLDTLGAGALLAYCRREKIEIPALWIGPLLLAVMWFWRPFEMDWRVYMDIAVAWCGAWFVWRATYGFGGWAGDFLSHPIPCYVGRISYGVYLIHMFFIDMPVLQGVLITFALASLSFHFFETPINNLKRFFPYERRPDASLEHIVMERRARECFGNYHNSDRDKDEGLLWR